MIGAEAFDNLMGEEQSQEEELLGLQQLVDSGAAWSLEGSVGRACMSAIEDGAIVLGPVGVRDYYGSYVPSRFEVKSGTKGSVAFSHEQSLRYFEDHDNLGHAPGLSSRCPKCRTLRAEKTAPIRLRGPQA